MKAHFILILVSIILLPSIYFLNGENAHWSQLIPLGYLVYSLIVGCISLFKIRK
jgi:hypothetical protein